MPRRSDDLSGRFWCGSVVLTNEQKVNNMTIILAVLLLGVIAVAGTKIVKLKNLNRTIDVNLKLSREKVADLTLENSKLAKKLEYAPVQVTNNVFDGGLLGDPETQAKKVLDVLELSGSRKEELTKKVEAVEEKVKNAEAQKRADENLESIVKASQKASEKAKSAPAAKKKPSSSSRSSSSSDSSSAYLAGGYIAGSYDSGSSSSSSSYGCGSSSSSSSFDSGSSFSGGCDSGGF
ncbi:hypothetical protein PBI_PEREGRIN_49 [Rhodococcus phage Peregrin]|nr:hypothetical protein PBI_PEREGRIN_49 [Rhodococcus phage Peregrin]